MINFHEVALHLRFFLDYGLRFAMKNGPFYSIFLSLFVLWGYWYPYQWWQKYGLPEITMNEARAITVITESRLRLPETFWGSSLLKKESSTANPKTLKIPVASSSFDFAGPILDEVKMCFGEGAIMQVSKVQGDLNQFLVALKNELGPVQEDLLLERRATLTMKDGKTRTLVYEWISPDEGGDLYWHENDQDGFPRSVDLPDNLERDLVTFEHLKSQGEVTKLAETRLVQLNNDLQIGIEKWNDVMASISIKDEGHLIKCRRDPAKSYVCDCLN